jgi:hypothetical protein
MQPKSKGLLQIWNQINPKLTFERKQSPYKRDIVSVKKMVWHVPYTIGVSVFTIGPLGLIWVRGSL